MEHVEQLRVDDVDFAGSEVAKELVHPDEALGVVPAGAGVDKIERLVGVGVDEGQPTLVADAGAASASRPNASPTAAPASMPIARRRESRDGLSISLSIIVLVFVRAGS